jgi:hypothetical protein
MAQRSISKPGAIEARRISGRKAGIQTKTGIAIKPEEKFLFFFKNNQYYVLLIAV